MLRTRSTMWDGPNIFVVSVSPERKEHPVVIVTRYKLSVVVKSSSSDSVTHNTEKGQVF